ncbi:hypothetical protein J2W32_004471 [Variovorax boronicumulans]|uniref:EF-hand domain-containing protein n=1 Tax=Variovorax boronicumulans TaxID=436515 RepID=A0AAW8D3P7_9BURK|nr:hypothetical protein [Variovorax boronicumulans]MDP9895373.1 hypothetical protein [Variovorax boronicumulans]MDQ0055413.1 hypothetical protein [Variovorax boronicumulans]
MDPIEQFLTDHQDADGNLSNADMAKLLTGGHEGDTAAGKPAETGAPAAGTEAKTTDVPEAGKPAATEDPAKSVILAKDGVHTIDYQKLVDAREEAKAAKAEADALKAQLAEVAKAPAAAPPAAAPPAAPPSASATDLAEVFGDYSDEAVKKGVNTLVANAMKGVHAELDAKLKPVEAAAQTAAFEAHLRTIYGKHPDAESIVVSTEYQKWLDAHPSFIRDRYEEIRTKGTADQVVELLDAYKAAQPAKAPPAPAAGVDARVEEALAKAKPRAPASLSDIPAGSAAHHDEAGAMAEMTPMDLMNKFAGKSPAEIETIVRRLV